MKIVQEDSEEKREVKLEKRRGKEKRQKNRRKGAEVQRRRWWKNERDVRREERACIPFFLTHGHIPNIISNIFTSFQIQIQNHRDLRLRSFVTFMFNPISNLSEIEN